MVVGAWVIVATLAVPVTQGPISEQIAAAPVLIDPVERDQPGKWLVAGAALDLGTTCYGVATRQTYEVNPLMFRWPCKKIAPVKIVVTAAQVALLRWLSERHPKLAKWLDRAVGLGSFAISAFNVRELLK